MDTTLLKSKWNRVNWDDPSLKERLGKEPDSSIAADVGCSRERVRQVRSSQGISSHSEARRDQVQEMLASVKGLDILVGQVPDSALAEWLKVDNSVIREYREGLGFPVRRALCGTRTSYNRGCRCEACNRENADQQLAWRAKNPAKAAAIRERRVKKVLESAPHEVGDISKYACGCRCDACRVAGAKWGKANREKHAEAARMTEQFVNSPEGSRE